MVLDSRDHSLVNSEDPTGDPDSLENVKVVDPEPEKFDWRERYRKDFREKALRRQQEEVRFARAAAASAAAARASVTTSRSTG